MHTFLMQERATKVSHANTARLAAYHAVLSRICVLLPSLSFLHSFLYFHNLQCSVHSTFLLQERATKVSHANTARLAAYHGDAVLSRICGLVASDEGRHEAAYTAIMEQLFMRCVSHFA